MYKLPYILLKQRIEEIVNELKGVEPYFNQDSTEGDLLTTPKAFIEFKDVPTNDLGNNVQEGELNFDVILCTKTYKDKNKWLYDDANQVHLDLSDLIFKALSGFSAFASSAPGLVALAGTKNDYKVLNSITRTNVTPVKLLHKNLMSTQSFKCHVKDRSAKVTYQQATPDLVVNLDIVSEI